MTPVLAAMLAGPALLVAVFVVILQPWVPDLA